MLMYCVIFNSVKFPLIHTYYTTYVYIFLQYFAGVSIEDPKLAVMCDKAGLPLPYNILMECVQRLGKPIVVPDFRYNYLM